MATQPRLYQIIVKGTSKKVRCDKHLRPYIRDYLDETVKAYLQRAAQPMDKPAIISIRGIDYQSIHAQGLVTVHGYLRKYVMDEAGKMPEQCTKEELIPALASAMHTAGVRLGRARTGSEIAAKFVFALSPEVSASWKNAGVDIDAGLRHIVEQTMERYRIGVMDGAEVGYAVGIHHDREHQHGHVILMLHAENGKRLKLSNRHEVKLPDGSKRRIDHLTLLTNTANAVLIDYQKKLTTATSSIGERRNPLPDLERWITLAACDHVPEGLKGNEAEIFRTQERERLRRAPADEIVIALDNAYQKRLALFHQCQSAALNPKERDKLLDGATRYRALIAQYSNSAREVAALQRKRRKERLDLLKARLTELQILNKVLRVTKMRVTPASFTAVRELQQELLNFSFSSPTIRKLVDERLRIVTGIATGQKFDRPAKLAEALNRENIGHWRESLERQYNDARNAANKVVEAVDFDASTCATYIESLKANLDIYKCALEMRKPVLLTTYAKLRADKDINLEAVFAPALEAQGQVQTPTSPPISLRI